MRNKPELYNDAIANVMEMIAKRVEVIAKRHGMEDGKLGTNLMSSAFSPKNPFVEIIMPHDITAKTKVAMQVGFMHLFIGASMAIRNIATHVAMCNESRDMTKFGMHILSNICHTFCDRYSTDFSPAFMA